MIGGFASSEIDAEYEFTLFKKVLDSLAECKEKNEVESKKSAFCLNEIILNANFANFSKIDAKTMRQFVDEIKDCISSYIKLEEDIEDDDYVEYSSSTESDTDTASNEGTDNADDDSKNNSY